MRYNSHTSYKILYIVHHSESMIRQKDYYMVAIHATIQTQVIWYPPDEENHVVRIWAHEYIIPREEYKQIENNNHLLLAPLIAFEALGDSAILKNYIYSDSESEDDDRKKYAEDEDEDW